MLTVHSDNIGLHHQTTNPRYVPKPVEWSEGVIPFIKVIHMPQRVASCVLCMLHFWSYRGLTRSVGASHGMRSRSKVPRRFRLLIFKPCRSSRNGVVPSASGMPVAHLTVLVFCRCLLVPPYATSQLVFVWIAPVELLSHRLALAH
jgi:hypothetical protein